MNGTTNYIMDAMHKSDVDFADVLKKAQELGYAEADPSADIDGWDIQRKLIISAGVAFGVCLQEDDVPVFGIRNVSAEDIKRFQARGRTCKLIASAEKLEDSVAAYVEPTLLTADALEAAVPANFNLISMEGEYIGKESFFGQGAGRYPTAYNVVQDLLDIAARREGLLHRQIRRRLHEQRRRPAPLLCAHERQAPRAGRGRRGKLGRRRRDAPRERGADARAREIHAGGGRQELLRGSGIRRRACSRLQNSAARPWRTKSSLPRCGRSCRAIPRGAWWSCRPPASATGRTTS